MRLILRPITRLTAGQQVDCIRSGSPLNQTQIGQFLGMVSSTSILEKDELYT